MPGRIQQAFPQSSLQLLTGHKIEELAIKNWTVGRPRNEGSYMLKDWTSCHNCCFLVSLVTQLDPLSQKKCHIACAYKLCPTITHSAVQPSYSMSANNSLKMLTCAMTIESGMQSKTSGVHTTSLIIIHCWCGITIAVICKLIPITCRQTPNLWSTRYFKPVLFFPGEIAMMTCFTGDI